MSNSLEARCLVIDFVSDLADAEPDPRDWGPYLHLLLQRLETEAEENGRPEAISSVFATLHDELNMKMKTIR